jgi:hypothetical protein
MATLRHQGPEEFSLLSGQGLQHIGNIGRVQGRDSGGQGVLLLLGNELLHQGLAVWFCGVLFAMHEFGLHAQPGQEVLDLL